MGYIRKALLLIFAAVLIFAPINVFATDTFLYSTDYFSGDDTHANNLKAYCTSAGHSSFTASRPTMVYGINSNLLYSTTLFISTHGRSQGSALKLYSTAWYTAADLSTVGAEFVFYSACYGAKTDTWTGVNLCSKTITNGASAAVGYADLVDLFFSRFYEDHFYQNAMTYGNNIYTSYINAKADLAQAYGTTNTVYTSVQFFGNGGLVIQ